MASTLTEVRDEVAVALAAASVTVHPLLPPSPQLPCAVVMFPNSVTFDRTLGGLNEYDLTVTVYVGLNDVDYAQRQLDEILSNELKGMLEGHTTTVWRALHVTSINSFRSESFGDAATLAADLNFTLIA